MEMELFVQWWQGMPALLLWENVFFRLPATLTSPLKGNSHRVPCIFLGPVGDPKTMAIFQGISGSDFLNAFPLRDGERLREQISSMKVLVVSNADLLPQLQEEVNF